MNCVVHNLPARGYFGGSVENWNDALLGIYCDQFHGMGLVTVATVLYGPPIEQASAVQVRLEPSAGPALCGGLK